MTMELLTALVMFTLVSSITPGPNNMMLMASGANFGLMRTIPHMLGVGIGFTLMVVLVGIGIMQLFDLYPLSYDILRLISVVYLLYLAYKIATASSPSAEADRTSKPISFIQAALFQWVNPKAWTMALTAISIYAPSRDLNSVLLVALAFAIVSIPSIGAWAVLGKQMQRLLTSVNRLRVFNGVMALLLVGSLYPVLLP